MPKSLEKVLVANRGEIAVRIIRACKEQGLRTLAIYSEADAGAPHTLVADESVLIGPAAPAQSYLDGARIIEVARLKGARAIHPGYGFLSENAPFAAAVEQAGLAFIGPSSETIALLGDKGHARALALEVGVPVIAGEAAPTDEGALAAAAERLGYPVMLKAVAGGGGKGMRVVRDPKDLSAAAGSARREAASAFGNDLLLLERFIEHPRHIEVQILADAHGGAIHLGERECSIQRRHQKIIEECPSPRVDETLRAQMGAAALALVRASGYRNAGTVEFLVAPDGSFYFLEVNTRLQVEHPVTELVTRFDLVHEQLRIAAGHPLSATQDDVTLRGHAIECRVYAEDPGRDFAPSPGKILHLYEPQLAGLRIDSGIRASQAVPMHYDPILSKVIAWAPTREGATARLLQGLDEYSILGVETNIAFLKQVLKCSAFQRAELSTDFLAVHLPSYEGPRPSAEHRALAATVLSTSRGAARKPRPGQTPSFDPWETLDGWRLM